MSRDLKLCWVRKILSRYTKRSICRVSPCGTFIWKHPAMAVLLRSYPMRGKPIIWIPHFGLERRIIPSWVHQTRSPQNFGSAHYAKKRMKLLVVGTIIAPTRCQALRFAINMALFYVVLRENLVQNFQQAPSQFRVLIQRIRGNKTLLCLQKSCWMQHQIFRPRTPRRLFCGKWSATASMHLHPSMRNWIRRWKMQVFMFPAWVDFLCRCMTWIMLR